MKKIFKIKYLKKNIYAISKTNICCNCLQIKIYTTYETLKSNLRHFYNLSDKLYVLNLMSIL